MILNFNYVLIFDIPDHPSMPFIKRKAELLSFKWDIEEKGRKRGFYIETRILHYTEIEGKLVHIADVGFGNLDYIHEIKTHYLDNSDRYVNALTGQVVKNMTIEEMQNSDNVYMKQEEFYAKIAHETPAIVVELFQDAFNKEFSI